MPSRKKNPKRKTPPTTISILGRQYRLTIEPGPLYVDRDQVRGRINYTDHTIAIDADLAGVEETLLHEVLHGVADGLELGFNEKTITRLTSGLFSAGVRVPVRIR